MKSNLGFVRPSDENDDENEEEIDEIKHEDR